MKKLFSVLCVFISFHAVFSQTLSPEKQLIRTTGFSINALYKNLILNQKSSEDFTLAVIHQRYAITLFEQQKITDAIFHSAYARRLSMKAMTEQGMAINPIIKFTDAELLLLKNSPDDSALNNKIPEQYESAKKMTDGERIKFMEPPLMGIDL